MHEPLPVHVEMSHVTTRVLGMNSMPQLRPKPHAMSESITCATSTIAATFWQSSVR